jgi:hypothetical protein
MTTELSPPSAEALWFARLDRVLFDRDHRCHGRPFRTLFHRVLSVEQNDRELMEFEPDGRCSGTVRARYRPNPWHSDPPDPELIKAGVDELFDRIGEAAGIGPRPR